MLSPAAPAADGERADVLGGQHDPVGVLGEGGLVRERHPARRVEGESARARQRLVPVEEVHAEGGRPADAHLGDRDRLRVVRALQVARRAQLQPRRRGHLGRGREHLLAVLVPHDHVGRSDAERNCISNVRPGGLDFETAAFKLHYLMENARHLQLTGVDLKDDSDLLLVGGEIPKTIAPGN